MKRFILCLLIAVSAVCVAFAVAACAPNMSMHNYSSEWSCDEDTHFHRCTDSGCYKTDEPVAHDWVLIPGKTVREPTCGIPGYGEFKCSVCGATIDKEIPATEEHNWEDLKKESLEATCGEDGFTTRQCKDCKKFDLVTVPATGEHTFGELWADSEDGEAHYAVCSVCGAHGEKEAHTAGTPVNTLVDNVNLTDGSVTTYCTKCNHIMEQEIIYAEGVPVSFELKVTARTSASVSNVVNDELGTSATVRVQAGNVGNVALTFQNLKDRDGNDITELPDKVTVRVTFKGSDDIVMDIGTQPGFNSVGNIIMIDKTNYPEDDSTYILVELLTGKGKKQQVRASRNLFLDVL